MKNTLTIWDGGQRESGPDKSGHSICFTRTSVNRAVPMHRESAHVLAVTMRLGGKWLRSRFLRKARSEARAYPVAICKRRTTMPGAKRSSRHDRANCMVAAVAPLFFCFFQPCLTLFKAIQAYSRPPGGGG